MDLSIEVVITLNRGEEKISKFLKKATISGILSSDSKSIMSCSGAK